MRAILQVLAVTVLLSGCVTERTLALGEVRCVLMTCRAFSRDFGGKDTVFVGARFEIQEPRELKGKSIVLMTGHPDGYDLIEASPGTEFTVDLSRTDVVVLPGGSLEARSPFNFRYKKEPDKAPEPTPE